MWLIVVAALACAVVVQNIRMNRELRAQRIEAERRHLAEQRWNIAVERFVDEDPLQNGSDVAFPIQDQRRVNRIEGPKANSETE